MKSRLFKKIRTVNEKEKLIEEIDTLIESFYKDKGDGYNSALNSKTRFWVSEIIKEETQAEGVDLENYFKSIKDEAGKFKVITLKIAFEPTDVSIDKFFWYVQKNIGTGILLDFDYDPSLLGGAVVTYEGEYRDFSLRRLFESEYETKRGEILKIVYHN